MKILIVEDKRKILPSIKNHFKANGLDCETVNNYKNALSKIDLYNYKFILLDLADPNGYGFDILTRLKERNKTEGIIIISDQNITDVPPTGFKMETYDCFKKPFDPFGHLPKILQPITWRHSEPILSFLMKLRILFS